MIHLPRSFEVSNEVLQGLRLAERTKERTERVSELGLNERRQKKRLVELTLLSDEPFPFPPIASNEGVSALDPSMNALAIDSERSS